MDTGNEYLEALIPKRSDFLQELRKKSALPDSYAPIIEKMSEQLLVTMLHILKPKRVLEIGTAVGYSAILMADNLPEHSEVITIERYKKHADIAIDNIFKVGYEKKIRVVEGEAAEVLAWLDGSFDFVTQQKVSILNFCLKLSDFSEAEACSFQTIFCIREWWRTMTR